MVEWWIGNSGKKLAESLSWVIWPKALQQEFDLDLDASGGPSVYIIQIPVESSIQMIIVYCKK